MLLGHVRPLDGFAKITTFSRCMSVHRANTEAFVPFFRRIIATLGVGLVLLLGASTASPGLHHLLHGDGHHEVAGDNCAVVLFASGITLAASAVFVSSARLVWYERAPGIFAEIFMASPRYLRQPERGPPAC
jgi:hypothetical protein